MTPDEVRTRWANLPGIEADETAGSMNKAFEAARKPREVPRDIGSDTDGTSDTDDDSSPQLGTEHDPTRLT